MASPTFRSSHIPLGRYGRKIVAERGRAVIFYERTGLKDSVTTSTLYEVSEAFENRAPSISNEVYGDEKYWWIICIFNGILDPTKDITVGLRLLIPDKAELDAYLSRSALGRRGRAGQIVAV